MKFLLLLIAVTLMSSGVHGISQSRSCSTVNGRTICEDQQSTGNTAFSSSVAMSGPSISHQDVYAGAGNPGGEWASGRQTATGVFPDGSCDDDTDDSSYSDNSPVFVDPVLAVIEFGGVPFQQGPQQGYQQGPQQGYQQAPQQGYPQEQQQQQVQEPFNPFQFVNQFMNGGAYAGPGGAYAGPGGAYAGQGVAYAGPGVAYAGPGVAYAGGGAFPLPFPFGRR